jgi:hypothetical protein
MYDNPMMSPRRAAAAAPPVPLTFNIKRRQAYRAARSASVAAWTDASRDPALACAILAAYPALAHQTPDIDNRVVNEVIVQVGFAPPGAAAGADKHYITIVTAGAGFLADEPDRAAVPAAEILCVYFGSQAHGDQFLNMANARLRRYGVAPVSFAALAKGARAPADAPVAKTSHIHAVLAAVEAACVARAAAPPTPVHVDPPPPPSPRPRRTPDIDPTAKTTKDRCVLDLSVFWRIVGW